MAECARSEHVGPIIARSFILPIVLMSPRHELIQSITKCKKLNQCRASYYNFVMNYGDRITVHDRNNYGISILQKLTTTDSYYNELPIESKHFEFLR